MTEKAAIHPPLSKLEVGVFSPKMIKSANSTETPALKTPKTKTPKSQSSQSKKKSNKKSNKKTKLTNETNIQIPTVESVNN